MTRRIVAVLFAVVCLILCGTGVVKAALLGTGFTNQGMLNGSVEEITPGTYTNASDEDDRQPSTSQRLLLRQNMDTPTLPKGRHELGYRFVLEDWDYAGWDTTVIRNELKYKFGLTDRIELGTDVMYSCVHYRGWGSTSGFNDTEFYGKYLVLRESDWPLTASVGGRVFAPTGNNGFGGADWWSGGFVALSKVLGSCRISGAFGRLWVDETGLKNFNHWGVGLLTDSGLNLELLGRGKSRTTLDGNRTTLVVGLIKADESSDWGGVLG